MLKPYLFVVANMKVLHVKVKKALLFILLSIIGIVLLCHLSFQPNDQHTKRTSAQDLSNASTTEKNIHEAFFDFDFEDVKIYGEFSETEVILDGSMFYFVADGASTLTNYQSCILESTAKLHPSTRIFLIFLLPDLGDILQDKLLSILLSYDNIYIRYIKTVKFLTLYSTQSIKAWAINSNFQKSQHSHIFLNEVLSYSMVKKYGGVALNFDTFLLKPLLSLGNFLIKSDEDIVEHSPFFLHHDHPLLEDLLNNLESSFNPSNSQSIGRDLMTKTVKHQCEVQFIKQLQYKDCKKVPKILPVESFFPISQVHKRQMYDPSRAKLALKKIMESNSYGIKLWHQQGNFGSREYPTAFYNLSSQFCPMNVQILGNKHF